MADNVRCSADLSEEGVLIRFANSRDSLKGAANGEPSCDVDEPYVVHLGETNNIAYTYSVVWRVSALLFREGTDRA